MKNKKSLQSTYHILIKDCYSRSIRLEDGTEKRILLPEDERPSYGQFYYYVNKAKGRVGHIGNIQVDYDKNAIKETTGPGTSFEIVSFPLETTVISAFDREQSLGNPQLYYVIDSFSRMVVGFCLTLNNEVHENVALTIINTVRDKVEFCQNYGVEIDQVDWPCFYLPETFESESILDDTEKFRNIADSYGVSFKNLPTGFSQEAQRDSYEQAIREFVPKFETIDSNIKGFLTLSELTKILIQITLYYNFQPLEEYPLTEEMIREGIKGSPVELWHWGINHSLGRQKEIGNLNSFRFGLLPKVSRRITSEGISLNNIGYSFSDDLSYQFLNNNIGKEVEVAYDQNDSSYLLMSDGEQVYQLKIKEQLNVEGIISHDDLGSLTIKTQKQKNKYSKENLIKEINDLTREAEENKRKF